MKYLKFLFFNVICVTLLLLCSNVSFVFADTQDYLEVTEDLTIADSTIYISDSSVDARIVVKENATLILGNIEFSSDISVSKVIVVESGGKLILNNVDFSNINADYGIYNLGEVEINNVTFDDSISTSIFHNSSYPLVLRKGKIESIHLESGYISVDEDTVLEDSIDITLGNEENGRVVVKGDNTFANYYLDKFNYTGDFSENGFDGVLDYIGEDVSAEVGGISLSACDIILTTYSLNFKVNGTNIYFAGKYTTANKFLSDIEKAEDSDLPALGAYKHLNGYYLDNIHGFTTNTTYSLESSEIVTARINLLDSDGNLIESKSTQIPALSSKAIFVDIPSLYSFDSISSSSSSILVSSLSDKTNFIRFIIDASSCDSTVSCDISIYLSAKPDKTTVDISFPEDIEYSDSDLFDSLNPYYIYNEEKYYLDFNLSFEGEIVTEFKNAGTYLMTITSVEPDNIEFSSLSKEIKITPKSVSINILQSTFVYSGNENTIVYELDGICEGDTCAVNFSNSSRINAGSQEVTVLGLTNPNYELASIPEISLVVEKATPTLENISFESITVEYTGENYSIFATNIPDYLNVEYYSNNQSLVGEYTITAKFSLANEENYELLTNDSLTATLTIEKASISVSALTFSGVTKVFDASETLIYVSGTLPEGIESVSYDYYIQNANGDYELIYYYPKNASTYQVKANFIVDSSKYKDIPSMTAYIVIEKATLDISELEFKDEEVTYDGYEHSLMVTIVPEGVICSYSQEALIEAGTYPITVTISVNENYYEIDENTLSATLVIKKAKFDMSQVFFLDYETTYDQDLKEIYLSGTLPEGVSVDKYTNNSATDAGVYNATVTFLADTKNHEEISPLSATLKINPIEINVSLKENQFTYTGEYIEVEAVASGVLEGDIVDISLVSHRNINAGNYFAQINSISNSNYICSIESLPYTISKAIVDMSGISFPDIERVYDGQVYTPELIGTLPEFMTANIVCTEIKDVGVYSVYAEFVVDNNHIKPSNMSAEIEILPKHVILEFKNYKDLIEDGNLKYIDVDFLGVIENDFNKYTMTYSAEPKLAGTYTVEVALLPYTNYILDGETTLTFYILSPTKIVESDDFYIVATGGFLPNADISLESSEISKDSEILSDLDLNINKSTSLKFSLTEISEPVTISLQGIDTNKNIKLYRVSGNTLTLVDIEIKDNYLSFELNGNEEFLLIEENTTSFGFIYLALIILLILLIISFIITYVILKKKLSKKRTS